MRPTTGRITGRVIDALEDGVIAARVEVIRSDGQPEILRRTVTEDPGALPDPTASQGCSWTPRRPLNADASPRGSAESPVVLLVRSSRLLTS